MIKPDDPQDRELGTLYRAAAQEAPSPGLDARILAAAREAATPSREAPSILQPKSWTQRWRLPAALAATVLMTSTLTLLVREHDMDGVESSLPIPAPKERKSEAAAAAPPAVPASVAPASPVPQPAPRAAPEREDAGQGNPAKDRLADRPREEPKSLQQPDLAAKRAGPTVTKSVAESVTESTAGAAAMQSAPAAEHALSAERAARPAQSGSTERGPEQWLAEIRRLRLEGRIADAEASLASFRRRHPQFPLPGDMKRP